MTGVETPAIVGRMPGKGTKRQSFRLDGEDWDRFVDDAVHEGTNASAKLREYVLSENARARIARGDDIT